HGTTYCSVLASRIGFLLVRLPQNPQAFLPCDKNELGVETVTVDPETIGPDPDPHPTMASVPARARDRGTDVQAISPEKNVYAHVVSIDPASSLAEHNARMLDHARRRFDAVDQGSHTVFFVDQFRLRATAVSIEIDPRNGKIMAISYTHQQGDPLKNPRYLSQMNSQAGEGDFYTFLVKEDGSLRFHKSSVRSHTIPTLQTVEWLEYMKIR
ncbi:MAG: hypothetical protein HY543_07005, partial [Deltaproteobacteria bacterium]|nr:hypothetical protein [Deltaproteobacteria bacterium]